MSAEATAALVRAIDACDGAWRDRWDRHPRAVELVHAFEICLVSSAENLVADVDDCVAMMFPEKPAAAVEEVEERRRIRPTDLDVVFRGRASNWEPFTATVVRRDDQRCVLELILDLAKPPRATTLVIDYKNPGGLTVSELRSLTKAKIVQRFASDQKLEIDRVLLRPLEGLDDPFELDPYEV